MKTDIEIAQSCTLLPITAIGAKPVSYTHLAVMEAILEEARRLTREGLDPDYWQRMKRGNFGASLNGLNSFDSIAISLVEGCFPHFDPLRFPELYDSITRCV